MLNPALRPLRSALIGVALVAAASLGHAAPDKSTDAVTQLLFDRGVLDPTFIEQARNVATVSAPALGQQVRDATSNLVISAMGLIGVPYKRGGNDSDTGFDCSGFTRHLFENSLGLLLPRKVDDQAKASGLVPVKRNELKPGDLVFFNTLKRTFSHVGIYLGDDKFIHAPRSGAEVRIESLDVKYWAKRFTGARRADPAVTAVVAPASVAPVAAPGENPTAP
jgi:cell wall-associated NlpC family hydrolase